MNLEFWANIAQILSLPISIVALFVGGKAISMTNKIIYKEKNSEVNKTISSKNRKNIINNKTNAINNSSINNYITQGLDYMEVDGIFDSKFKKIETPINNIRKLQNILDKNDRYSIPVTWSGTQIEYDKMQKNGEIVPEVTYMIIDD